MSIISQETWDNMPEKEKEEICRDYMEWQEIAKTNPYFEGKISNMEELFGKENLQPNKIKTWEDVEKHNLKTYGNENIELFYFNEFAWESQYIRHCIAALKISKLIELGYGGMVTEEEWKENGSDKGFYYLWATPEGEIECTLIYAVEFIAFHSEELAKEFMSYPENLQLIKDYYMI